MSNKGEIFKTSGCKKLYGSIPETVGNTPVIRLNALSPDGVRYKLRLVIN